MIEKIETSAVSVKIENLSLSFGETKVLKDINLTIEPGEFFAFLGPSGSGKSTLLRAIAGFGPAPGGRILIGEDEVTSLPPWKRNVGMVFQSYALWPHMTVRKNVAFGLEERRVPKSEISERVEAALDLVGLTEFADRRPSQLSGGQQQRVALARTVVIEPRVLLLDEPLSNLDANLRIQMRREILELQRKLSLTTIFVTHDQEEANTTSDRIAVLNDGIIQQIGAPIELYDQPANRFVANFLGIANLIDGTMTETEGRVLLRAADGTSISLEGVGARTGENKTMMFRPQNLIICDAGDPPAENRSKLSGRVERREFLGNIIRYAVSVGEHSLLVDDTHQTGHGAFDVGADVALYLSPNQVRLLPN
jgi:iron(III) transport system ATP-binding protein